MTLVDDGATRVDAPTYDVALDTQVETPRDDEPAPGDTDDVAPPSYSLALAAFLGTLAGVWMITRLFFDSTLAFAFGGVGAAVGVGLVVVSFRLRRPGPVQYLVLPAALALGAFLATTGGARDGSLPNLVADAIRDGGLSQPPIPFEPGWRFLLAVLPALTGACALALAGALRRPKLVAAVPLPLVLGGALLQPPGSEVVASSVAIVLLVASLALAYGVNLAADGDLGARYEIRRLARAGVLLAAILGGLIALAQTDLLFPATDTDQVVPPQKPPAPPPERDRVLFTVESDLDGPWRVGVLDVYKDDALLLPSLDPARLVDVPSSGEVAAADGAKTYVTRFTAVDVRGQTLPAPPNPVSLKDVDGKAQFDPRTQVFKLAKRAVPAGLTYTVVAAKAPDGKTLAASPPPRPAIAEEFLDAPPRPPEIDALLAGAPTDNAFDRLQYVRQQLYANVVAAGEGTPGDVPPLRIVDMLSGGEANPYEIVAAEVVLARWAGVPSRLGFGFFGGEETGTPGVRELRPRNGAAFLEVYFEGHGWVPIVGTPPRAKASLSDAEKNKDPRVVPTDELGLIVYVPVELRTIQQLYEVVRYAATIVVPILLAIISLLAGYPALLKLLRTARRRRWAAAGGGRHRIAVAYAELRDRARDLNIGDPAATPLELLAAIADDEEHAELAWLVTRALWGDLRRDLRIEDVEAAESMARSVTRRLQREQTALNRLLAAIARTSLRSPWSSEIPNVWLPAGRLRVRLRRPSLPGSLRRRLATAPVGALVLVAVAATLLAGCGSDPSTRAQAPYPDRLTPHVVAGHRVVRRTEVEGRYREPKGRALVTDGRVFTIEDDDVVQGSFQVARFRPDVDGRDVDVQTDIERGLGAADRFGSARIGVVQLRTLDLAEQRLFLWFPPTGDRMELWVMRKDFDGAADVVAEMIGYQRGAKLPTPAIGSAP